MSDAGAEADALNRKAAARRVARFRARFGLRVPNRPDEPISPTVAQAAYMSAMPVWYREVHRVLIHAEANS